MLEVYKNGFQGWEVFKFHEFCGMRTHNFLKSGLYSCGVFKVVCKVVSI